MIGSDPAGKTIEIKALRQVRALDDAYDFRDLGNVSRRKRWESTGDDPGFLIPLKGLRPRYVVCTLIGDHASLDPRLYVDHGFGFREPISIELETARRHLIVIDVGVVGAVRALRLDPASFPATFSLGAESLASAEEVQNRVQVELASHPDTAVRRIGRLNRLMLPNASWLAWARRVPIADHLATLHDLAAAKPALLPDEDNRIWLSLVVPVYNTPPRYLDDLIGSVRGQGAAGVELLLCDDGSTAPETRAHLDRLGALDETVGAAADPRILRLPVNGGIAAATNAGIAAARGHWLGFVDHDDLLAPHALKIVGNAIHDHPEAEFFYTDEVVVDDRLKPIGTQYKPAYDPVLLSGVNYINHLSVYRRSRVQGLGALRLGFDGSQDYDLLLRYLAGLHDRQIVHIPYPAYWWRRTGQTFSRRYMTQATATARRALGEAFGGTERPVAVEPALTPTLHRVAIGGARPKISVVIPNKDAPVLIRRVLADLTERTAYADLEIIVVDNGSTDEDVLSLYRDMGSRPGFTALVRDEPFNFSRSVNRGMAAATGEHVLLLNNDVEVIDADWLGEMVDCLSFPGTGVVGAKLLFPDDTLQHAGVAVGFGGLAGHLYLNKAAGFGGPMNRLHVRNSMTCVTGAVMLISGACRAAVGAFDETNFAVAYNDVDYCLRARAAGFRSVWTPFACLVHHESATRGSDMTRQNRERFEREKAALRAIHGTERFVDPATSPLMSANRSTPVLIQPKALPRPRHWFADRC